MVVRALLLIVLAHASFAASPGSGVYAGGVAGASALADPEATMKFRKSGGGLYLHNVKECICCGGGVLAWIARVA